MNYSIRRARIEDSAQIAPLIYDAIGNIAFRLTGETEEQPMLDKLQTLIKLTNNRHSYLYTHVAVDPSDNHVLGIIVLYDGQLGYSLDRSLEQLLRNMYDVSVTIDVEAHLDEFYIDTICVSPEARGMGLGSALLQFAETTAIEQNYQKLSLNVEVEKERARALYEKLGFIATEPWTIIDEPFIHMVKSLH